MHRNDNHRPHVVITTDLAGRDLPARAPLPEPIHICVEPGEELTAAEREALERFFAEWRRFRRTGIGSMAGRRGAA